MYSPDDVDVVKAIKWKMGMLSKEQVGTSAQDWAIIWGWLRDDDEQVRRLIDALAEPLMDVLRYGMTGSPDVKANPNLPTRWAALQQYLQRQGELPSMMAHKAASLYSELKRGEQQVAAAASGNSNAATSHAPEAPAATTVAASDGAQLPQTYLPDWVVMPTAATDDAPMVIADSSEETLIAPVGNDAEDEVTVNPAPRSNHDSTNGETMKEEEAETNQTQEAAGGVDEAAAETPAASTDEPAVAAQPTPSVAPQWKYIAVPEDEPDKHTEYDTSSGRSPEGLKIIGARARGKKHKHEGTNCDDWFAYDTTGPWTVIAVSDGAGSKKFSRVGAKAACTAAVKRLVEDLSEHLLTERDEWTAETLKRNETDGTFLQEDLDAIQAALHRAMNMAYDAMKAAVEDRLENPAYEKLLGRRLEVEDLSATLLLAVHSTVRSAGADRSFILTCQVGDGMLGAVDRKGRLQLLGEPDSGEFAGQTDFLTSRNKLERDNLWRKTFGFFRQLEALMVMTDGVADDYYPNDPGLLRLYGDLVLNGIIGIKEASDNEIAAALAGTQLPTLDDVMKAEFHNNFETNTAEGMKGARIRSVEAFAEKLGKPLAEVVASPALLSAGARGEPMSAEEKPEERLRVWLDTYQVRGSFDDRTLVVLHRESAS
jgi:serine/threonine protein phosphatase PrpC